MPNTFLKASKPESPIFLSNHFVERKAKNTNSRLSKIPSRILPVSNLLFKDKIVVKVPAPAMMGKARGTIAPLAALGSSLKNRIPKIISKPIKKIIREPARAKEATSIPKISNTEVPKKRNSIIKKPAISVVLAACTSKPCFFKFKMMGKEPGISITVKRMRLTERVEAKNIKF